MSSPSADPSAAPAQDYSGVGLLWFQIGDLRLADNPALSAGLSQGQVIPFFAWAPAEDGSWAPGGASRWWLHHTLEQLGRDLERRGSRLIIRSGASVAQLLDSLAAETGATRLYFNRGYTPAERVKQATAQRTGLQTFSFNARQLVEPSTLRRNGHRPYQVFSAFWRSSSPTIANVAPSATPARIPGPAQWPASEPLDSLGLLPVPDCAGGLRQTWQPGEANGQRVLQQFVDAGLEHYRTERDRPDLERTSRLSPYLHFGEIGPRQIWSTLQRKSATAEPGCALANSIEALQRELGWREFATHLVYAFPQLADHSLDTRFDALQWQNDRAQVRAWQRGRTGYPLVDAGLRQLWQTGWMHNRVRMVVASFFVKDLLSQWQDGARWFWDTLVDADLANNSLGWQWAAGSGPDAAPFTRVFNPTVQAQRFDPHGTYIRRFVPELTRLPTPYLHSPWTAPPLALAEAGVSLGRTYPWPIVDHAAARSRALTAFNAPRPIARVRAV